MMLDLKLMFSDAGVDSFHVSNAEGLAKKAGATVCSGCLNL